MKPSDIRVGVFVEDTARQVLTGSRRHPVGKLVRVVSGSMTILWESGRNETVKTFPFPPRLLEIRPFWCEACRHAYDAFAYDDCPRCSADRSNREGVDD